METRRTRPIGFAHRGGRSHARENTLEAFSLSLQLGAEGIESDAWLTADRVVVLHHDGTIGPPWRQRRIADLPRTSLPDHVPALEDLYRELGGDFQLSLDIKDQASFRPALETAGHAGAVSNLWLCDPDPNRVTSWVGAARPANVVLSTRLRRLAGGLSDVLAQLSRAGVAALNLRSDEWRASTVSSAHHAGLLAFAWDAQSKRRIRRLIELGLDGIYSDHVDRLVAAITAGRRRRSTAFPGATKATPL